MPSSSERNEDAIADGEERPAPRSVAALRAAAEVLRLSACRGGSLAACLPDLNNR
jgi:hypothetical protein